MSRSVHIALAVCLLMLALSLPLSALAQSSALEATIRAELLKDPRSAAMTEAELDALVQLLAAEAGEQGVSGEEIEWRSEAAPTMVVAEDGTSAAAVCDGFPQFFCTVRDAFGFDGSNYVIPIGLLATSGLLWLLLHELRHHHRTGAIPLDN